MSYLIVGMFSQESTERDGLRTDSEYLLVDDLSGDVPRMLDNTRISNLVFID